jgi:23S rRNA (adenine2030-N6)-methyltransferase
MLAYRHLFHAGNFADVFKHALLARLLLALNRKDKPYLYLDTHAGTGLYDLSHPWAQKNAESREGIARVLARDDAPAALAPYLEAVRAQNPKGGLRFYPGSPGIAHRLLRQGDRMVLNELNRADFEELQRRFEGERRVTAHRMDGYQALKAFLPPPERRGLVLMDSAFDRSGELARLTEALAAAHKRWATGVYALWYPLMEPGAVRAFERGVLGTGIRRILRLELSVQPERWSQSLRGSGLLVVNPPYGLEEEAGPMLDWLWRALAPGGAGGCAVNWLVPE